LDVSERRARRVLGQQRSAQRKVPCGPDDEGGLAEDLIKAAKHYGRYSYRRVTSLLQAAHWSPIHKRVRLSGGAWD
jgi:putative transposase